MTSHASLTGRTVSGVAWMICASGGQTIFQFILFIVLARKLGPEAFGVVAIAGGFIELFNLIGRAGLTEVLIQKLEVDDLELNTAFWISLAFGAFLTALTLVLSGRIAHIFSVPMLKPVMELMAPVSLFFAIGAVYEAILRRSFGFKSLAARNFFATIISGSISLVMALNGFGAFSLVAQRLVYVIWLDVAMLTATQWLPEFYFSLEICRRQLRRGSVLAASTLLSTGNQRIIDLIIGYFLGPASLGYMRVAWRALDLMMDLSIRPISAVTLTSLSQLQNDAMALKGGYIRTVQMTAVFVYPLFMGVSILAPELIASVFGAKWQASVIPLQILAMTSIFIPLIYYKTNALMAVAKMDEALYINIFEFGASVVIAALFCQFGLASAAFGNVARMAFVTPVIMWNLRSCVGIPFLDTLKAIWPPAGATVVMIFGLLIIRMALAETWSPWFQMSLLALAGIFFYGIALWVLQARVVLQILILVKSLLLSKPRANTSDA